MPARTRRYARLQEAADYSTLSTFTLRRRIADGSLTGRRLGKSRIILIDLDELDALLRPIPSAADGAA